MVKNKYIVDSKLCAPLFSCSFKLSFLKPSISESIRIAEYVKVITSKFYVTPQGSRATG